MAYDMEEFLETIDASGAVRGDSGYLDFPVSDLVIRSTKTRELLSINPPKWQNLEIDIFRIFCQIGFDNFCWVEKFTDPRIDFFAHAFELRDVHIYLLSGRATGVIVAKIENFSTEGIKEEFNVKTGEIRNTETVSGSGTLGGLVKDTVTAVIGNTREVLGSISSAISKLAPQAGVFITGNFEMKGHVDIIKMICTQLRKGYIHVDDVVIARFEYEWFGRRSVNREFKVDSDLPLAAPNELTWHLW